MGFEFPEIVLRRLPDGYERATIGLLTGDIGAEVGFGWFPSGETGYYVRVPTYRKIALISNDLLISGPGMYVFDFRHELKGQLVHVRKRNLDAYTWRFGDKLFELKES